MLAYVEAAAISLGSKKYVIVRGSIHGLSKSGIEGYSGCAIREPSCSEILEPMLWRFHCIKCDAARPAGHCGRLRESIGAVLVPVAVNGAEAAVTAGLQGQLIRRSLKHERRGYRGAVVLQVDCSGFVRRADQGCRSEYVRPSVSPHAERAASNQRVSGIAHPLTQTKNAGAIWTIAYRTHDRM